MALLPYLGYALMVIGLAYSVYMMTKGGPEMDSLDPSTIDDFAITTADEGSKVPLIYGIKKVTGNIIYYGGLRAKPITETVQSGCSSEKVIVGYDYYIDIWMTLAHGPVSLLATYVNEELTGVLGTGEISYHQRIFSNGVPGNGVDAPIAGQSPLPGIAWIYYEQLYLGENVQSVPTIHYVLQCLPTAHPFSYVETGNGGVNPATVVYDLLVRSGVDYDGVNATSFENASLYWFNKEYGLHMVYKNAIKCRDAIKKALQVVGGSFTEDTDGKFYLIPFDETETSSATLDFDQGEVRNFKFYRPMWDTLYSDFVATYIDRNKDYSKRTVRAYNPALHRILGRRVEQAVDLKHFIDLDVASKRVWEIMKEATYPGAQIECEVPFRFSGLLVGQVVTVNNSRFGISNAKFRLMTKNIKGLDENFFGVSLKQMTEELYDSNWETSGGSNWEIPDYTPDPLYKASVWQLPFNHMTGTGDYNTGFYLVLAARKNLHESGYYLRYSQNGNVYDPVAGDAFSQYGTLDEAYGITNEIDETVGFTYTPYREDPAFDSIAIEDAINMNRMALIEDELIGFTTVTNNANGSITLTGIIRGMLGTTIAAHNSGVDIWIFTPTTPGLIFSSADSSFYLMFQPHSISGVVATEDATVINVTKDSTKLVPPAPVVSVERTATDDFTITWYPFTGAFIGAGQTGEESFNTAVPYAGPGAGLNAYKFNYTAIVYHYQTKSVDFTYPYATYDLRATWKLNNNAVTAEARPSLPSVGSTTWAGRNIPNATTGLLKIDYGMENFIEFIDYNADIIDNFFNMASLLDVSLTSLADEDYLMYDHASGKFVNVDLATMNVEVTTTTSTTTTTTTSTTTTSTTTTTATTTTGTTVPGGTTTTAPPEAYSTGLSLIDDTSPLTSTLDYRASAVDGNYDTKIFSSAPSGVDEPDFQEREGWLSDRSIGKNLESPTLCYGMKIVMRATDSKVLANHYDPSPLRNYMYAYRSATGSIWTTLRTYNEIREFGYEYFEACMGNNFRTDIVDIGGGQFETVEQGENYVKVLLWFTTPVTYQYFKALTISHAVLEKQYHPVEIEMMTSSTQQQPTIGWMDYIPGSQAVIPPNVVFYWFYSKGDWSITYGTGNYSLGYTSAPYGYRDAINTGVWTNNHLIVEEPKQTGKYYVEFTFDNLLDEEDGLDTTKKVAFGVAQEHFWNGSYWPVSDTVGQVMHTNLDITYFACGYRSNGNLVTGSTGEVYFGAGSFNRGDKIGIAIDIDNEKIWFSKNGAWSGNPALGIGEAFSGWMQKGSYTYHGRTYYFYDDYVTPMVEIQNSDGSNTMERVEVHCHSWQMSYAAPSGFTPWGD